MDKMYLPGYPSPRKRGKMKRNQLIGVYVDFSKLTYEITRTNNSHTYSPTFRSRRRLEHLLAHMINSGKMIIYFVGRMMLFERKP